MPSVTKMFVALLTLLLLPLVPGRVAFYPLFFKPKTVITKFECTATIPANSPDSQSPSNDFQGFWPGLETTNGDFVLQNKSGHYDQCIAADANSSRTDGNGLHLSPDGGTEDVFRVYPGDRVQTIYTLDTSNGNWNDDRFVTRGQVGNAAKQDPFSGNLVLDPRIAKVPDAVPYTLTVLTIELQEEATWDFGAVNFTDITIVAETTDTAWCTDGPFAGAGSLSWQWYKSPAIVSTSGGTTTCYYSEIILISPN